MTTTTKIKPYTILADIYDDVMAKVNYELWADFIDEVIQRHHPRPVEILELACGTGLFSFELERLSYNVTATDASTQMLEKARVNARHFGSDIPFKQADFLNITLNNHFDIIVTVFDSVNYLLDEADLLQMFGQVKKVMKDDGLYIFDFTTPLNSLESIHFLNDRNGSTKNGYRYFRKSRYDEEQQIHYNTFEIEKYAEDNVTVLEHFSEHHKQRTYTLNQMRNIIAKTDFTIKAGYGEFDMRRANKNSHRITLVTQ